MAQIPDKRLQQLANKWLKGTLTESEQQEFDAWFHAHTNEAQEVPAEYGETAEEQRERIFARIQAQTSRKAPVRRLWPRLSGWQARIAAAASILLILSFGGYLFIKRKTVAPQTVQFAHDIAPGKNQATLILADGKKIALTKGLSGQLAQQGNTQVAIRSNTLAYTASANTDASVQYNTMSTARGEQSPFPLVLADGTKVWLDAASSITFPTAFTGKERSVKVSGQAWFEVKHNAAQPFRVHVKDQVIEDIGTVFNVNAYDDEPAIITTLVSGSIAVNQTLLRPGQEAINKNNQIQIKTADIALATAWKDGYFRFDHTDLHTLMRQVARWYDLDVVYQGTIPEQDFGGQITREVPLAKMLRILATANVHFEIENNGRTKQLIIKP